MKTKLTKRKQVETISAKEAATLLGLDYRTVLRNIDDIPHRRVGKRLIFSRKALLLWLEFDNNGPDTEVETCSN